MPVTDLNRFRINLSEFVTIYPKFLVLHWFITHIDQFEQELKKMIKEVSQELKCISTVELELVDIDQEIIVIEYNDKINKIYLTNFDKIFQTKFLTLLKALEPSAEALVKQITCVHCKAIYSLIKCNLVIGDEDVYLQCPVCKEFILLDLDNNINPLFQIEKIYEQIKN